jgi:F-type H+-transporting ATPase subunit gamma
MAKGTEIKRRIKSIKSMLQVTKAMELVSSIKMRKANETALRSKSYVFESWRSVIRIAKIPENANLNFFKATSKGKILALAVTSDKGLCGSYNADILRQIATFTKEHGSENIDFITVGSKGRDFIKKIGGNIVADFPPYQNIRFTMTSPIGLIAWQGFNEGKYSRFISIHTHFESVVRKKPTTLQILPVDIENIEADAEREQIEYKFEPSHQEILPEIVRQIVRALTYQVILESEAAEHASRMIAMKNATESAQELKEDFEFTFNQLRQQNITQELAEISAGVNALY